MNRLIEEMVFVGFVIACRFAGSPTFRSPPSTNPTTDGVVLFPSELAITTGSFPSITDTHEFVVPKSIPIIFPIFFKFYFIELPPKVNLYATCIFSKSSDKIRKNA